MQPTKRRKHKSMKKIYSIFLQIFIFNCAIGQGTWTWISGTNAANSVGVYGTQGVPSVNNHPPPLYEACDWKDKQGNFWIYGGMWDQCDLWKYNPTTNEWTWIKGPGGSIYKPVYGAKGQSSPNNTPGIRG